MTEKELYQTSQRDIQALIGEVNRDLMKARIHIDGLGKRLIRLSDKSDEFEKLLQENGEENDNNAKVGRAIRYLKAAEMELRNTKLNHLSPLQRLSTVISNVCDALQNAQSFQISLKEDKEEGC